MEAELEIDLTKFERQFAEFMVYSTRTLEEEFRGQCKGLMDVVLDITPPAHGKGTRGKARMIGQRRIGWDTTGGGHKKGRGQAGVFTVLSDSLIASARPTGDSVRLWVKKDGTVYLTEGRFFRPDASLTEMRDQHKRFFKNGRMTTATSVTREDGRAKWIGQMVVSASSFERYMRQQKRKVGIYAAGFAPAARMLGATLPAYAKSHNSTGNIRIEIGPDLLSMVATNEVGYREIDSHMRRILQWAVDRQTNKMASQIPNLIRAAARRARMGD